MWPPVKRENNIGTSLDKSFWNEWGPTYIYYFNSDIFNDDREIKSIFFTYEPFFSVSFDEKEIAMAIHYECGEFGQHIGLFSYVDIPNIKHGEHWDYYVYPNISTDLPNNIYFNKINIVYGNDNLYELYLGYKIIDKYILLPENYEKLKSCLRSLLDVDTMDNYINLLEIVALHGDAVDLSKKLEWSEKFLESCSDIQRTKLVNELLNNEVKLDRDYIKRQYNDLYEETFDKRENNDLQKIFINCRDLLIGRKLIVQYENEKVMIPDEFDNLFSTTRFVSTYGELKKDDNNRPVFVKRNQNGIYKKGDNTYGRYYD